MISFSALVTLNSIHYLNFSKASRDWNKSFLSFTLNMYLYLKSSYSPTTLAKHLFSVFSGYRIHGPLLSTSIISFIKTVGLKLVGYRYQNHVVLKNAKDETIAFMRRKWDIKRMISEATIMVWGYMMNFNTGIFMRLQIKLNMRVYFQEYTVTYWPPFLQHYCTTYNSLWMYANMRRWVAHCIVWGPTTTLERKQ